VRVVIADDAVLIRSGVATLLAESGIETVAQAADAEELLRLVARTTPDAAVVDIRMPPTHTHEGLHAARRIRREHPGVAVLLLSQYLDAGYALRLAEDNPAGVGYLLKDRIAHAATLADALHRLVAGECVVDPTIVSRLLARARVHNPLDDLTPREREVLSLMAEGRSNATIGRLLSLQSKTVETHVSRVFSKLGLVEEADGHRRVLAVLAYLRAESP
jgi:DNA-binding NarL/FixJ family response regulator